MAETIAVVGASNDRRKFGNKCVRAYQSAGFQVFPVNLREEEIEGLKVYDSLGQVPGPLDRISVYLPPEVTRDLLPEIARRGAREVWFNPGSADPEILRAAREAGIEVRDGCSITAIGLSPSQFA
ncbi:MAG: CoA-binding protein [Thermoanaerobaculia bacterium]